MTTMIEWAEEVWNPVVGCSPASEGCRACYAARHALRLAGNPNPRVSGPYAGTAEMRGIDPNRRPVFTGVVRCLADRLDEPLRWRKPRRVFVNSMSDLFHHDVPDSFIDKVFAVMALCPQHTFQILTKRADWMAVYLTNPYRSGAIQDAVRLFFDRSDFGSDTPMPWPLPNVWLGVSVEDQAAADERIPHLLRVPARVRFLSCEPLLGPVRIIQWLGSAHPQFDPGVDWVIVGGESGPGARPMDVAWARSLVEQCQAAGTSCFVKQLGARPRGECEWRHHDEYPPDWLDEDGALPEVSDKPAVDLCHAVDDVWWPCAPVLRHPKGGDMDEWPEDLRVREFPVTGGDDA